MNYGCGSSFWARIANPRYRGITAELLEYDLKDGFNNAKIEYPIFQRGIKYSFEIKAYIEWNGYKYEHIFDKIEGEYEWKK